MITKPLVSRRSTLRVKASYVTRRRCSRSPNARSGGGHDGTSARRNVSFLPDIVMIFRPQTQATP